MVSVDVARRQLRGDIDVRQTEVLNREGRMGWEAVGLASLDSGLSSGAAEETRAPRQRLSPQRSSLEMSSPTSPGTCLRPRATA